MRVLDVGCGLGGSARYLAAERQCHATGIDLTGEYVAVANVLAEMMGLNGVTAFCKGDALNTPFHDGSFDVVWTEAVQMNIEDKRAFYAELGRVLCPGGRLAFHDIFQGEGGDLHYPVPWAEERSISHLATPQTVRGILQDLELNVLHWEDKSRQSLDWLAAIVERSKAADAARLGLHLLMGSGARAKLENNIRNLVEGRFVVIQAVAEKVSRGAQP
jgi:ubiquinone/menaquinone biosynthesis C-methylase UbiE